MSGSIPLLPLYVFMAGTGATFLHPKCTNYFCYSYHMYLLIVGVEVYCCTRSHIWAHTHTHTHTLGRVPLDEGSVCRRGLYLYNI